MVGAAGRLAGRGARRAGARGVELLALEPGRGGEARGEGGVGHRGERGEVGDVDPGRKVAGKLGGLVGLGRLCRGAPLGGHGGHGEDVRVRQRVRTRLLGRRRGRQRRRRGGRRLGEGGRREPVRHAAESAQVGECGRPHRGCGLGERLRGLGRARRARALRLRALGSEVVSLVGDFLYWVALIVYLSDGDDGPAWIAAALIARFVPYVVLGPIGGAIADRFDRRRTLVAVARSVAEYGTTKSCEGINFDTALCFVGSKYTFLNVDPDSGK